MADTEQQPDNTDPSINVLDPNNQLVSIPQSQYYDAVDQGYKPAVQSDIDNFNKQQTYGTPAQQAKTVAEGLARGATFGASTGIETGLGLAKPEDIRAREEVNPGESTLGEIGSLLIPGAPEAEALGVAGRAAARAVGLAKPIGSIAKVGSAAVKGAVETGLVQGGNEVHKMYAQDPDQSAETAIQNIGLATLMGGGIGAGFGTVSPLWKSTVGNKLGGFLEAVQKRANGEAITLPQSTEAALQASQMEIAPEIRTALAEDPELSKQFNILRESKTSPGLNLKETLNNFYDKAKEGILDTVGKTPEGLSDLQDMSPFEQGSKIQDSIAKTVKDRIEPLTQQFEDIKNKFSNIPISDEIKAKISEDLTNMAQKEGYHISPDAPQGKAVAGAISDLKNVNTLEDLRKLQSNISKNTYDVLNTKGLNQTGKLISKSMRDAEDSLIEQTASAKSPQMLQQIKDARGGYKSAMDMLDSLNDRLHVGNYGGAQSFINSLKEMKPEDVLNRLARPNDAGSISLLAKEFPEVSETIRQHLLDKELKKALIATNEGYSIKPDTLFKNIDKMTPEMRQSLLNPQQLSRLNGIRTLLKSIPEYKSSGTAGHLDALMSKSAGSATGIAAMLLGHNPFMGYIMGQTGKWLGRDVPDAIRLSFLKFLGSAGKVEPQAFKTMVDYTAAVIKGENSMNKGIKNLFRAGSEVWPRSQLPSEKDNQKFDKKLKTMTADNSSLFNTGGNMSYYLPDHAAGLSRIAASASQYLNSLRPSTDKMGILDGAREPSEVEKENYNEALTVAQQPMSVLQSIKDGTVTTQDIVTLRTIYPNLYTRMSQKVFNQIAEHVSSGKEIPYNTRIGLSLFLAQPLDSSMTPQAIQANQMVNQPPQQPQPQQGAPKTKGSKMALNKLPNMFATSTQSRAMQRGERV